MPSVQYSKGKMKTCSTVYNVYAILTHRCRPRTLTQVSENSLCIFDRFLAISLSVSCQNTHVSSISVVLFEYLKPDKDQKSLFIRLVIFLL